jgi:2-desacetyl-2-hydroxyethyl bacteriochlorophyllide A dehydrogenase
MPTEQALWFVAPRKLELRESPTPAPAEGEVLARALYSGVSQGTELLLYRGEGPEVFDSSLDTARASTYPCRYGYSWVGEIVHSRARDWKEGTRVFALQPHASAHCVRADQLRRLPTSLPSARATLAANMETALTVIWDAGISLGDHVVVLGGGVVGLLCVLLAKRAGALRVRLIEPAARRREAGLSLGADQAVAPNADEATGEADVVIEASGDPACLDQAIAHAGSEATVVVASFYGQRRSPVSLGSEFHRRRLTLQSSQVSRLPGGKTARWDHARRFDCVLDCLCDARLDAIVGAPVPFREAPAFYAALDADPGSALHSVFDYR